jgi:phosphoribosylaminoimidazole (AIR) synthetase
MGWGFALIIDKENTDEAVKILNRAGCQAQEIGHVTKSKGIKIFYKNCMIKLTKDLPR